MGRVDCGWWGLCVDGCVGGGGVGCDDRVLFFEDEEGIRERMGSGGKTCAHWLRDARGLFNSSHCGRPARTGVVAEQRVDRGGNSSNCSRTTAASGVVQQQESWLFISWWLLSSQDC